MARRMSYLGGVPAAKLFAASLGMIALLALPALLRGQVVGGPVTYMNRNCPGGAPPSCYFCNGNQSPGTVPAGCTNGNPPNWAFGRCDPFSTSMYDCVQQYMGCGDNVTCAPPMMKLDTCGESNLVCQNYFLMAN